MRREGPADTARLRFRALGAGDAAFILALMSQPAWARFIGAHTVTDIASAQRYLHERLLPACQDGMGFHAVERLTAAAPIGICGLVQRPYLDAPDLGFAYLPHCWRQGYGREAALSVLDHAATALRLQRVLAITSPANRASIALLKGLGFGFSETRLKPDGGGPVDVYLRRLGRGAAAAQPAVP